MASRASVATMLPTFCYGLIVVVNIILAVEGFNLPIAASFPVTLPLQRIAVCDSLNYWKAPPSKWSAFAQSPDPSRTTGVSSHKGTSPSSALTLISTKVSGPFAWLLLSQFLLFIGVGAVIPVIPLYGKEIGLSSAANGIVISTPAVALLLAANWGGKQADLARKPAMIGGMALIALSDIGTALSQSLPAIVVARLGLGAGRALSESGERGMLFDLANQIPSLRGRALAAQQAVVALGIAIGAPVGGVVVERYGPRAAFLCVSASAMVTSILYCFLPETVAKINAKIGYSNGKENGNKRTIIDSPTYGFWKELLKQDTWRGLALCQSGASFGFAAKIASIPVLAAATLPGGATGAGALISAAGLSGLLGAPLGGWSTDRIGAKWTGIISGIVSGMGLILVPVSLNTFPQSSFFSNMHIDIGGVSMQGNGLFFSLAVVLWSLGAAGQGPAITALAQENAPAGAEASSLALVKASGDATYIFAPFFLGSLADSVYDIVGIECAMAGAISVLGVLALARLVQEPVHDSGSGPSNAIYKQSGGI